MKTAVTLTRETRVDPTAKGLAAEAGMVPTVGYMNNQKFYTQQEDAPRLARFPIFP